MKMRVNTRTRFFNGKRHPMWNPLWCIKHWFFNLWISSKSSINPLRVDEEEEEEEEDDTPDFLFPLSEEPEEAKGTDNEDIPPAPFTPSCRLSPVTSDDLSEYERTNLSNVPRFSPEAIFMA